MHKSFYLLYFFIFFVSLGDYVCRNLHFFIDIKNGNVTIKEEEYIF